MVDQFLLLGFGATGKEVASNYNVKHLGEETIDGQKTVHLELVPKSKKTLDNLRKVELWMAESGSYPVRQKFYQPSGDSTTVTYTDVKLNPALKDEALALKLPAGVKRVYPNK
jgi:outer membrane lipoprotein-sorting protein